MRFKKFFKKASTGIPPCYNETPTFIKDTGSGKLFTDPCDPNGMFIGSQNEARVLEFFRKAGIPVNRKEIGYIYRFGDHTNSLKTDMSAVANVLELDINNDARPFIVRPKVLIPFEVWGKNTDQALHRDLTKEALYKEQSRRNITAADLLNFIKIAGPIGENTAYGFKRALKEVLGTYLFRKTGAGIISIEGKRISPNYLSDVLNQSLVLYTPPVGLQMFEGKQTTRPVMAEEIIQKFNLQVEELSFEAAENIFNDFTGKYEESLKYGGKHIDALIDRAQVDQIYTLVSLIDEDTRLNQLVAQQFLNGEDYTATLQQLRDIRTQMEPLTNDQAVGVFMQDAAADKEVSASLIRILAAANTLEGGMETKDKFFKDIDKFMKNQLSRMNPDGLAWVKSNPIFKEIEQTYNKVLNDNAQLEAVLDLAETLEDKQTIDILENLNDSLINLYRKISEFKKFELPKGYMDKIITEKGYIKSKLGLYQAIGSEGDVDNFLNNNPAYREKIGKKPDEKPNLFDTPAIPNQPIMSPNTIPGNINIGTPPKLHHMPEDITPMVEDPTPQDVHQQEQVQHHHHRRRKHRKHRFSSSDPNGVFITNQIINLTREEPKESKFKGFKKK